jgi:hypothetical protein
MCMCVCGRGSSLAQVVECLPSKCSRPWVLTESERERERGNLLCVCVRERQRNDLSHPSLKK